MSKGPKKKPKQGAKVLTEKRAKAKAFVVAEDRLIRWSFRLFDREGSYDQRDGGSLPFNEIAHKLRSYETYTWKRLRNEKRGYNHAIETDRIILRAKKRLEALKYDDRDELWRLRFSGSERLWGLKIEDEFCALWWDPHHDICRSHK